MGNGQGRPDEHRPHRGYAEMNPAEIERRQEEIKRTAARFKHDTIEFETT
jgi:hypothetical protein